MIITTIIIINTLTIAAIIINAKRYNAPAPVSLVRSRRQRRTRVIRKRQERKADNTHIAERISHGKQYNRPTYLALRRAAAEAAAAALPRVKRFNSPKRRNTKRSTANSIPTIITQPIALSAASDKATRYARLITEARTSDDVYRNWVESTDDLGFDEEIYNTYKSRKAELIAA